MLAKRKKWIKAISLVLLPAVLLSSLPLDALAQQNPGSSGSGITKQVTDSAMLTNYHSSYKAFITELQLTMKELSTVNRRLGGEIESEEELSKRLRIIKTLQGKTTILKHDIDTINDVALALSFAPPLKAPMGTVHKGTKKIKKALKKFDKKIKPLYKKVTTFKQRVLLKSIQYRYEVVKHFRKVQAILNQSFLNKVKQMDGYIKTAAMCVRLDADLSALTNILDELTLKLRAFRQALEKLNNLSIDTSFVLADILNLIKEFYPFKRALMALNKLLRKIRKYLRKLGRLLKKYIRIKIEYKWLKFYIKISIKKVLNGVKAIIRWLKHRLKEIYWKAIKALGVKKIIKKIIRKARRKIKEFIDKIMSFIDKNLLGFNLNIFGSGGGLSLKFLQLLDKLEVLLGKIKDIDLSIDLPSVGGLTSGYLEYFGRFRDLCFSCGRIKKADIKIDSVAVEKGVVEGEKSLVKVKVSDIQDLDAIALLKKAGKFDASRYNRKCKITLESDHGYTAQTDEFIVEAGKSKVIDIPWVPQGKGDIKLIATASIIDAKEANLDNNTKQINAKVMPPSLDIGVEAISFEDEVVENTPSVIDVRVANLNQNYTARAVLKLTVDDGFSYQSKEISILPQSTDIVEVEWTPATKGTYHVQAELIPAQGVRDVDQSNNKITASVEVNPLPLDVAITALSTPKEVETSEYAGIKVRVKNNGPKDTEEPVLLTLTASNDYKKERKLKLHKGEEKEIAFRWRAPKSATIVQVEAEASYEPGDIDENNNAAEKNIEVKKKNRHLSGLSLKELKAELNSLSRGEITEADIKELEDFYRQEFNADALKKAEEALTGLFSRNAPSKEEIEAQIKQLIEKLKTDYSRGDKTTLMKAFSQQFPNYAMLIKGFSDDVLYFRNINMNYRIESITISEDKKHAIANVYWEISFMMPNGRFYKKTTYMKMRFANTNGKWAIGSLIGNNIFGSSWLSYIDLLASLSNVKVSVVGSTIQITGVILRNRGNEDAQNFRVKFTYTRSTGQSYTAYVNVGFLRSGSQTLLTCNIPAVVFIPSIGDKLTVEVDPDNNLPEIRTQNNSQFRNFPF